MENRILESDLRLPALYIIKSLGGITTSDLSIKLRELLNPTGADLEILQNRNDDHFSQIVRNLTASARTFVKDGYIQREESKNSILKITQKGENYLCENNEMLEYLLKNEFDYEDIKDTLKNVEQNKNIKKIELFEEDILISEGVKKIKQVAIYERSKKLRDYAIKYYTIDGKINCKCCNFDFNAFYGELGNGFIEIHHTKPIFKYEDDDLQNTLENAVENLIPLCSNCHRMVHRSKKSTIEVQQLINIIAENRSNNPIKNIT
jgi:5-methylcytosine-specific restriction enzyme A